MGLWRDGKIKKIWINLGHFPSCQRFFSKAPYFSAFFFFLQLNSFICICYLPLTLWWKIKERHITPVWALLLFSLKVLVAQLWLTLCDHMDCSSPSFLCPWNSPGKNTGVCCHSLLQGIFMTQGSNPGLLHWGRFFTVWVTKESWGDYPP